MTLTAPTTRLLSLYPNAIGLCYALFEGSRHPVDWGIRTARREKHATMMRHASTLITAFAPSTILLPSRLGAIASSRRLHRISVEIERLSLASHCLVHWHSRADIKAYFSAFGAGTKDAIAAMIARLLPELEQHLPPPRKLWMSEDCRMGLFDAVALAMTHCRRKRLQGKDGGYCQGDCP